MGGGWRERGIEVWLRGVNEQTNKQAQTSRFRTLLQYRNVSQHHVVLCVHIYREE